MQRVSHFEFVRSGFAAKRANQIHQDRLVIAFPFLHHDACSSNHNITISDGTSLLLLKEQSTTSA